jgi:hypothetical protein
MRLMTTALSISSFKKLSGALADESEMDRDFPKLLRFTLELLITPHAF